MKPIIFETKLPETPQRNNDELRSEDGGCAIMANLDNESSEMSVTIHSWDDNAEHKEMSQFYGKKIRVTIEIIA